MTERIHCNECGGEIHLVVIGYDESQGYSMTPGCDCTVADSTWNDDIPNQWPIGE